MYFPLCFSTWKIFYFSTQHRRFREFRAFWALSQGIGHSCMRVSWPIVAHIRALWQPICSRAPLIPYDGLKASTRALGRLPRRGHSRMPAAKREPCAPRCGAVGRPGLKLRVKRRFRPILYGLALSAGLPTALFYLDRLFLNLNFLTFNKA